MSWKINRDYYYADLYALLGLEGIEEAGYFDDTATVDYNIKDSTTILCTPIAPIASTIAAATNPCVLITTGAFCPIHQGHIDMMVAARKAVDEAGYDVLAAYISPGHDEYINLKIKEKAIPIHYRIKMIQEMIQLNGLQDWLLPDPWEGVFNRVAVNFTDVVYRLELYLAGLFEQKISVFFVCGADNARFALTFMQKGHCVVVGRPRYEQGYASYKERLLACSNILWTSGNNPLSSTQIRKKEGFQAAEPKDLHLRVENEDKREAAVIELLKPYFKTIHYAQLAEQRQIYKNISPADTISLDAYLPGNFNLQLSRVFDLFGLQQLGYTNRPDSAALEQQVAAIPAGDYCLFDDDIHSGNTIKYAQNLLQKDGRRILGIIAMNLYQKKNDHKAEVLDCRDFLIGGVHNGLVVRIKDKKVRAPYIYPYVCPFVRASISEPLLFSIAVWEMNLDYYRQADVILRDCPLHIQDLYEWIGFDSKATLSEVCEWHVDLLKEVLDRFAVRR